MRVIRFSEFNFNRVVKKKKKKTYKYAISAKEISGLPCVIQ